MTRLVPACVLAWSLVAPGMSLGQGSPASKVAAQKGWLANYETARALAQKTGKPLLVVFRCDP